MARTHTSVVTTNTVIRNTTFAAGDDTVIQRTDSWYLVEPEAATSRPGADTRWLL